MTPSFPTLVGVCILLCVVQFLAALPWLVAVEIRFRKRLQRWSFWGIAVLACAGAGLAMGIYLDVNSDGVVLARIGRVFAFVLHAQLSADFFVFVFAFLLRVWPKGGAVALSAFREGVRQPMFWLLFAAPAILMIVSPFVPYFTFGDDLKMVKELCYAFTMLFAGLFGVMASSMSVTEEIEGRTAVTLMSKPLSRRQFLVGKFMGVLMAAGFMTALLGFVLIWVVLFAQWYIRLLTPAPQAIPDPTWVVETAHALFPNNSTADLVRGFGLWLDDAGFALPMLIIGFCQVMVLVAIAVALATRVPLVINLAVCLLIYFLGHLTPIMTEVTRNQYRLIYFVAQLFDTVLPGLDLFDVGPAIVREVPLPPLDYSLYTLNVTLYALVYTVIALLFGLILFEDRDLA